MDSIYDIDEYDYDLPVGNIAQVPAGKRDESRLLIMRGKATPLEDREFGQILELFRPGDLLVVNDTKVFPARLLGAKETGGRLELFMLHYPVSVSATGAGGWQSAEVIGLIKSSKRPKIRTKLLFGQKLQGEVVELRSDGQVKVLLSYKGELTGVLEEYGSMPLPPYIDRRNGERPEDRARYQTIYASRNGAVAAPTAGLHFTEELFEEIRSRGTGVARVTLHVGYGTFAPVRVKDIRQHRIHREYVVVKAETATLVNETLSSGGRIWAVGTTTLRTLEFAADEQGMVHPKSDWCDLYIYPGYRFRVVKNLITNFHLPRSSLLFLVSALVGRTRTLQAYRHAVEQGYRFYSYGDAMVIME